MLIPANPHLCVCTVVCSMSRVCCRVFLFAIVILTTSALSRSSQKLAVRFVKMRLKILEGQSWPLHRSQDQQDLAARKTTWLDTVWEQFDAFSGYSESKPTYLFSWSRTGTPPSKPSTLGRSRPRASVPPSAVEQCALSSCIVDLRSYLDLVRFRM